METSADKNKIPTNFSNVKKHNNFDYLNKEKSDSNFVSNIVEKCFDKRFRFNNNGYKWELPIDPQGLNNEGRKIEKWQIEELERLKVKLNNVKSKLNSFNFGDWHKHTRYRNPGGLIMRDLRNFEVELLTQAWCKFYELLNIYKIVPDDLKSVFTTFHLCEAPGAFICSLNHYLKLNHPSLKWQWYGNTLNPYYEGNGLEEMINDDRFISKTLTRWLFGEDYTGNLRHKCNLEDLKTKARSLKPIQLVTADGSIDCCKNPGDQEIYVLPLHYSEAITALNILSPGGNFVIKIFTIYECETVCLLYLFCCVFKDVSVHKPVVSKEGNSEVYIICCDYIGYESCKSILDSADYFGEFPRVLFRKEQLPQTFIDQIIKCSKFFTDTQISVLERNIRTYHSELTRKKRTELWKIRTKVAEKFLQLYHVYPLIDQSEYVLEGLYLSNPLQLDAKNEDGSFEDRVESLHPDKLTLLHTYQTNLEALQIVWSWPFVCWIRDWQSEGNESDEFLAIRGKPLGLIRSSKFCKGSLLKVINDLQNFGIGDCLLHAKHNSSAELNKEIRTLLSDYLMCNVENKFWLSDFHRAQKESIKCLIANLELIESKQSFVLTGLPLITQFNVGLVYTLASSFTEVGISNPEVGYVIIFKNLINFQCLENLKKIDRELNSSEFGVISIVPITRLLDGESYSCITTCNHLIFKNAALESIKYLYKDLNQSEK